MELCSILKVQPYPMPLLTCAGTIQAARCAGPLLTAASRGGRTRGFCMFAPTTLADSPWNSHLVTMMYLLTSMVLLLRVQRFLRRPTKQRPSNCDFLGTSLRLFSDWSGAKERKNMARAIEVEEGSGNVFADLDCQIRKSVSPRLRLLFASPESFARGGSLRLVPPAS